MRAQGQILSKQRCGWFALLALAVAAAIVTPCAAQETRTQQLEQQRDAKSAHLQYDQPQKLEKDLFFLEDNQFLDRLTAGYHGWNLRFGGLVQGSGFALGPEYQLHRASWGSDFFVGAQLSTKLYQKYYSGWNQPHLANNHFSLAFNGVHRNYSEIDYFGPGPRSLKSERTDYRLEDTAVDGAVGVKPFKNLQLGGSAGYLAVNVGPGQSNEYPSSELVFSPAVAPGIDHQTDFLRYGPYIEFDYLDKPEGPASGGLYTFEYTWYRDQKLNLHDFQRMDIEAQQYIPFFNKMRVIALRAKATLTDAQRGQIIPFYMQPIVGGSEDLRGFLPFRFYDNNSMVLNAEYRWHVISMLDMALFADGGKVFPRRGELNFSHLQGDGGIGFRFNYQGRPFIRVDIAGSHEGFQVWLKFNDIFARHPVGTASAQPIQ